LDLIARPFYQRPKAQSRRRPERGALKRVDHRDLGEIVPTAGRLRYGDAAPLDLRPSRGVGADNATALKELIG
jgi:CoA:oxalate CoA-transferase